MRETTKKSGRTCTQGLGPKMALMIAVGSWIGQVGCTSNGAGNGGGTSGTSAAQVSGGTPAAPSGYSQTVAATNTQLNSQPNYQLTGADVQSLQSAGVLSDGDQQALSP